MKLLIDKALSPKTVSFLNDNGYDAVRVNEVISGSRVEDNEIFDSDKCHLFLKH